MGNYTYDQHVDLFSGPPEPGEAHLSAEQIDALRDERKYQQPAGIIVHAAFSEAEFQTIIRALELSEHVAAGLRDERRTFALPLLRGRCQAMLNQARAE